MWMVYRICESTWITLTIIHVKEGEERNTVNWKINLKGHVDANYLSF